MSQTSSRFAQLTIEHVIAILQEDLPSDVQAPGLIGEYLPGLLSQLPFISVSAAVQSTRNTGLGGTIALKRAVIDGSLIDLGYVTGEIGECEFTLTLWAITRAQLEQLRAALEAIGWMRRVHERELPAGTLDRSLFLRCNLAHTSATVAAPLPPAPPSITVNANNTDLHAAPNAAAEVIGQASAGQQFELLGRSADGTFVQGCCFNQRAIWVAVGSVTTPIPVANIPVAPAPVAIPVATPLATPASTRRKTKARATARAAEIDPGTALIASAVAPVITAWRQDLQYMAQLEATQEPLTSAGELIQELRISRHLGMGDQILNTERTQLRKDGEQMVNSFPA